MNRKVRRLLLLVGVLCALAVPAGAVDDSDEPGTLLLDLATMPPGETVTRPGGRNATYNAIRIINAIPRFIPYDVDISIANVGIAPLSLSAFGTREREAMPVGPGTTEDPCPPKIAALIERLDAVEAEKDVPDIGAAAVLDAPPTCKDKVWAKFTSLTRYTITDTFSVKSNQTLTVTLSRPGAGFTFVKQGTARGEWRTSYGFFFVPDRDERYFSEETKAATATTAAEFTIKKQQDREEFDFVPTVVFTFFPNGAEERAGIGGWTAGLGYDLEKPFVFGGYSWAYNENVIFTGGLTFHRQSRLLGKYKGDDKDTIGELLEPAQLVEDTYAPNVYVGISFRFGEDIHARRKELEDATARAQQDASAAAASTRVAEAESSIRKAECVARAEAVAAAAKAEAACKDNALCIAKVEKEEAAAKLKCPLTELERVKAVKEEAAKAEALEKAEKRAACEKAAKTADHAALGKCTKDFETCKKSAKGAAAVKVCEDDATLCKTDAAAALAAAEAQCLNQ